TERVLGIEPPGNGPADVDRLMADVHPEAKAPPRKTLGYMVAPQAYRLPFVVKQFRFAIVDVGIGRAGKYALDGVLCINLIARIHKKHVISCRHGQPLVHRVVDSLVRLTYPTGDMRIV